MFKVNNKDNRTTPMAIKFLLFIRLTKKAFLFILRNGFANSYVHVHHCVKSVRIRSFSSQYFPAFGLNTERYSVSLRIQSECGKILTKKTPNTDTLHAMYHVKMLQTSGKEILLSSNDTFSENKSCYQINHSYVIQW